MKTAMQQRPEQIITKSAEDDRAVSKYRLLRDIEPEGRCE